MRKHGIQSATPLLNFMDLNAMLSLKNRNLYIIFTIMMTSLTPHTPAKAKNIVFFGSCLSKFTVESIKQLDSNTHVLGSATARRVDVLWDMDITRKVANLDKNYIEELGLLQHPQGRGYVARQFIDPNGKFFKAIEEEKVDIFIADPFCDISYKLVHPEEQPAQKIFINTSWLKEEDRDLFKLEKDYLPIQKVAKYWRGVARLLKRKHPKALFVLVNFPFAHQHRDILNTRSQEFARIMSSMNSGKNKFCEFIDANCPPARFHCILNRRHLMPEFYALLGEYILSLADKTPDSSLLEAITIPTPANDVSQELTRLSSPSSYTVVNSIMSPLLKETLTNSSPCKIAGTTYNISGFEHAVTLSNAVKHIKQRDFSKKSYPQMWERLISTNQLTITRISGASKCLLGKYAIQLKDGDQLHEKTISIGLYQAVPSKRTAFHWSLAQQVLTQEGTDIKFTDAKQKYRVNIEHSDQKHFLKVIVDKAIHIQKNRMPEVIREYLIDGTICIEKLGCNADLYKMYIKGEPGLILFEVEEI